MPTEIWKIILLIVEQLRLPCRLSICKDCGINANLLFLRHQRRLSSWWRSLPLILLLRHYADLDYTAHHWAVAALCRLVVASCRLIRLHCLYWAVAASCRLLDYTAHHWAVAASCRLLDYTAHHWAVATSVSTSWLYCSSLSSCDIRVDFLIILLIIEQLRHRYRLLDYTARHWAVATSVSTSWLYCSSLSSCGMIPTSWLYCSSLSSWDIRVDFLIILLIIEQLRHRRLLLYCSSLSSFGDFHVAHLDYTAHHWAVVDFHVALAYLYYTAHHWAVVDFHVALAASCRLIFIVASSLPLP